MNEKTFGGAALQTPKEPNSKISLRSIESYDQ